MQVTATVAAAHQEVVILRADGELADVRPMTRLNVGVIVEQDGRREQGLAGGGGRGAGRAAGPGRLAGQDARGAAHRLRSTCEAEPRRPA